MKRQEHEKIDYPPMLRFLLWIGKPLGLAFVPQHYVQAIYHMGKYAGCKGPGLIYINRLTETLGPLVFTGGQMKELTLENIISRDVLPVTLNVSATVVYDPKEGAERASSLTRIPREGYVSIASTYIRWALLAAANQYKATELTQHEVRAQIENAVRDRVNEELAFLGLKLKGKLRITGVQLPATLTERHEVIAQRRASILAGTEFHPAEYRRALVSEVIEHLAESGGAESFMNFGEMLETYASDNRPGEGAPPAGPRIIEHPPRALEDKGAPPPTAPPASEETRVRREPKPPSRRPRSRL